MLKNKINNPCYPGDLGTGKRPGTSCKIEIHFWFKITQYLITLSQQGPINVERARSMARSMTSPIHIFGLVHAM